MINAALPSMETNTPEMVSSDMQVRLRARIASGVLGTSGHSKGVFSMPHEVDLVSLIFLAPMETTLYRSIPGMNWMSSVILRILLSVS